MNAPEGITAGELARRLGGTLEGDPDRLVREVATLEEAGPDSLSWVGDVQQAHRLKGTRCGVVLVPRECEVPPGSAAIRVEDPDLALCEVLRWLGPPPEAVPKGIHPSAVVSPEAQVDPTAAIGPHVSIGAGACVGPRTQLHAGVRIGREASIGADCVLWPNVVVRERVILGDRVTVHPNATLGADGFGYLQRGGRHVKIPQVGGLVIEDDVEIGANTCIDRARSGVTRIGRGTKIDNLVQIGHNCDIGEDCVIVAQCGISGSTTLGRHVVLAGQVGLIDHLRIGDGARVAAKSGVARDIPPGAVYRGIPATDNHLFGRQQVAVRRLPKLVELVRELERRIERLESAADDRT